MRSVTIARRTSGFMAVLVSLRNGGEGAAFDLSGSRFTS